MMTEAGLRHLPFDAKTSDDWLVCRNGHVVPNTDRGPDHPPKQKDTKEACKCGQPLGHLFVEQRRLTWADESSIGARALLPNGRSDPAVVLREILARTCRSPNFPVEVDAYEDHDFAWFLYDWLGGVALVRRLSGAGASVKNSSTGSGKPSTEPPRPPT